MNTLWVLIGLLLVVAIIILRFKLPQLKFGRPAIDVQQVAASAAEYFTASGARVRIECLARAEGILLLIESEPLKRFRYSHIVEASLTDHLEKILGLHVSRVFWRFPLPPGQSVATDADEPACAIKDSDRTRDVRQVKTHPEYDVAEESWEQFEKARQEEPAQTRASAGNTLEEPTQGAS